VHVTVLPAQCWLAARDHPTMKAARHVPTVSFRLRTTAERPTAQLFGESHGENRGIPEKGSIVLLQQFVVRTSEPAHARVASLAQFPF
jgi:hypothetical protein